MKYHNMYGMDNFKNQNNSIYIGDHVSQNHNSENEVYTRSANPKPQGSQTPTFDYGHLHYALHRNIWVCTL